jgi:hypothetical protein
MKKITPLFVFVLVALVFMPMVEAKHPPSLEKASKKFGGKKHHVELILYEKDASSWNIVWDGAYGKLKFTDKGTFNFKGYGLEPETEYALIIYNDHWPGIPVIVLGCDVSDSKGNVKIKGNYDLWSLLGDGNNQKIWLVLKSDVDEANQKMV